MSAGEVSVDWAALARIGADAATVERNEQARAAVRQRLARDVLRHLEGPSPELGHAAAALMHAGVRPAVAAEIVATARLALAAGRADRALAAVHRAIVEALDVRSREPAG